MNCKHDWSGKVVTGIAFPVSQGRTFISVSCALCGLSKAMWRYLRVCATTNKGDHHD